jgi:competence protein ComEA
MRPQHFTRLRALPPVRIGTLLILLFASNPTGTIGPLASARVIAQEGTARDPLPQGPGRDIVLSTCGVCHEVDTAIGTRRTSADWKQIIDAMINRGAVGSDEDFKAVLVYMSKYFGPLNVNKATAKELEEVLHVTPGEAAAIVRYRTENGDFKTLAALMSVPGVDGKLIETQKDRVAFK